MLYSNELDGNVIFGYAAMITKTLDLPSWFTRIRETTPIQKATKNDDIPDLFPVVLRDPLLSPVETQFYQVLHAVAGKRVTVLVKMRLADLFKVKAGAGAGKDKDKNKAIEAFARKIEARSVDFVLCERYTLRPLLAIELYDHSQAKSTRKQRDPWLDKLFKSAKLPILHLVAQGQYNAKALSVRIAPYMTTVVYQRGSQMPEYALAPRCPCCNTAMVKRTVISGDFKGKTYFACQDYPNCCERLPLSKAAQYVN
jgi:hypothetical protein